MADCRDWTQSLFAASWNGIPFFVSRDQEDGGRRVIVHEFPMRDDPFNEDIGESPRYFDVDGYVASDSADLDATGLVAALAAGGPGILVLPTHGPIPARCLTFRRSRDKDRAGYIAFGMRFVREGVAGPLASVLSIANLVIAAADNLAAGAAAAFGALVTVAARPDYVVDAAVSGIRDGIAVFEDVRRSNVLPSQASADIALRSIALADGLDVQFRDEGGAEAVATELFGIARAISDAMEPADAVRAFAEIADQAVPAEGAAISGSAAQAASNRTEAIRVVRLAALTGYIEAVIRASYPSRREAVTARADVAERCDLELGRSGGYALNDVVGPIREMQGNTVDYLTRLIVDLAPVVRVEANIRLPSLWWSWRLYADPTRTGELVARNRVIHPSFMPREFEALAS